MQSEVMENLKKDLKDSELDTFPKDLLKTTNDCSEQEYTKYMRALAKIAYFFNKSGFNYNMNLVCYEGKGSKYAKEWLINKQLRPI